MKKLIATIWCALALAAGAFAQEAASQPYFIHENLVKPSMNAEYEAGIKKIKDACVLHKINISWITVMYDDNTYAHLFPISGVGALEKNLFVELQTKMGRESFAALWPAVDKCVDGKNAVVSTWLRSLSYLGIAEGETHLQLLFLTPLPGKDWELEALFGEWKKTYTAKSLPMGFQVYRTMFGVDAGYVIVLSAKDAAEMAAKHSKSYELASAEISKLWQKQLSLCKKYSWKRGTVLQQLGYQFTAAN